VGRQELGLDGIVVSESRLGWLTLELPPQERWQESLSQLPPAQRERIESPESYETLQRHIGRRFLTLIK